MDASMRDGLRLIARGLQVYGTVHSSEFVTRLLGERTGKEALDVVAEAERIGMIEPDGEIFEARALEQKRWRLVKGFDVEALGAPA